MTENNFPSSSIPLVCVEENGRAGPLVVWCKDPKEIIPTVRRTRTTERSFFFELVILAVHENALLSEVGGYCTYVSSLLDRVQGIELA